MDLDAFREYLTIHLISLEQDADEIDNKMNAYSNYEDDEYRELEIADISNTGEILATRHFIEVLNER